MVESCYRCGKPAPDDLGTIYVRHRNADGRWATDTFCTRCFEIIEPGRVPFRVRPATADGDADGI